MFARLLSCAQRVQSDDGSKQAVVECSAPRSNSSLGYSVPNFLELMLYLHLLFYTNFRKLGLFCTTLYILTLCDFSIADVEIYTELYKYLVWYL